MEYECVYSDLLNKTDICNFVSSTCTYTYFNLLAIHFCTFKAYFIITIPFLLLLAGLSFYIISDTSQKHLATSIEKISQKFNLSENLTGITFVAFTNQAPDIISALVASGSRKEGVDISLGALMGAGMMVTTLVFSAVVHISQKSIRVEKSKYIRDIVIYIFMLGILVVLSLNKKIKIWESIGFFSLYFVYAIIAIIQDKCQQISGHKNNNIINNEYIGLMPNDAKDRAVLKGDIILTKNFYRKRTSSDYIGMVFEKEVDKSFQSMRLCENSDLLLMPPHKTCYQNFKAGFIQYYLNNNPSGWNTMGIFHKIFFICLEFPVSVLRDLTIPQYESPRWNKPFFILFPFSAFLFLIIIFKQTYLLTEVYFMLGAFIGLITFCLLLYRLTRTNRRSPCWETFFILISFIMGIAWLWFVSEILVDILKVFGTLLEIPKPFLGMTLLAFGNSLPDFIINCALAHAGLGEMAISGSIAAPLFGALFGFGFSLIRQNISQ